MMIKVFGAADFEKICHLPAHVQASVRAAFLLRALVRTVVLIAEEAEDLYAIRELRLGARCVAVEQAMELFDGAAPEYVKTRILLDDMRVLFFLPRSLVPAAQWFAGEEG